MAKRCHIYFSTAAWNRMDCVLNSIKCQFTIRRRYVDAMKSCRYWTVGMPYRPDCLHRERPLNVSTTGLSESFNLYITNTKKNTFIDLKLINISWRYTYWSIQRYTYVYDVRINIVYWKETYIINVLCLYVCFCLLNCIWCDQRTTTA